MTDANGECEFVTIVPGWYSGRVTHVHFQVFVSTQYSVVSQWTWPHDAVVDAVSAHPDLYPEGPDPLTPGQDGVFADGFELKWPTWLGTRTRRNTCPCTRPRWRGQNQRGRASRMALFQGVRPWPNFPIPSLRPPTFPRIECARQGELGLVERGRAMRLRTDWGMKPAGRHSIKVNFESLGLPARPTSTAWRWCPTVAHSPT